MARRALSGGVALFLFLIVSETQSQAQYPGGFGEWGWMNFSSTAEGDLARGLGAFLEGAGFYNYKTAKAESIDADTIKRWNEYMYESNRVASRLHRSRLAARRQSIIEKRERRQEQLRNTPTAADITSGDALNNVLEEISDPRVYVRRLPAAKATVPGEMIRKIPFRKAVAGITVSIYQLIEGGPPAVLKRPEFAAELSAISSSGKELRAQIEAADEPKHETIASLLEAIGKAESKVASSLTRNSRERTDADRYLKALHGLIGMLRTPAIDVILAGVEKRPEVTLSDLVAFMNSFSLRFGAASSAQERQVYGSLYPKLVELRTEATAALASAAAPPSVAGAAEDFFSKMSDEDLKKEVPTTAAPK